MIFNGIITFLSNSLNFMLRLLPDADAAVTAQITGYSTGFRAALGNINWFFPVDTALAFLATVFIIQGVLFLYKTVRYIAGIFTAGILK